MTWRGEDGNASVAVMGGVAIVMVLLAGIADLAIFSLGRAKAQTAADAAALAAASELIPGIGRDPAGQAARFAAANGARLVGCSCAQGADDATAMVEVPVSFILLRALGIAEVSASARAEMDLSRLGSSRDE